jgi:hypothetical protein
MATKTKPVIQVDNTELNFAIIKLNGVRKSLAVLNEQEDDLKDRIKELAAEYEIAESTIFEIEGNQAILTPSSNKHLNKDLLIDAGVLPSQIEKGYKVSEFIKVEVKVQG